MVQPVADDAPVLVQGDGVGVSFEFREGWFGKRHFQAVKSATLALRRGETLGIVGESGSGKTTLGMALLALQPIAAGSVEPERRSASTTPTARRCARCGGACRWCSRTPSPASARA